MYCWKGLAMNAFGAKMLPIILASMIAAPIGFFCEQTPARGSRSQETQQCCHVPHQQTPAANICCCEVRLDTSEVVKAGQRAAIVAFAIAVLPAITDMPTCITLAQQPQTHSFFETDKHSLPTLFCVWRR